MSHTYVYIIFNHDDLFKIMTFSTLFLFPPQKVSETYISTASCFANRGSQKTWGANKRLGPGNGEWSVRRGWGCHSAVFPARGCFHSGACLSVSEPRESGLALCLRLPLAGSLTICLGIAGPVAEERNRTKPSAHLFSREGWRNKGRGAERM